MWRSGSAQTADKPNFGGAGENWEKEGWLVPVEFTEVDSEVRPKNFINKLKPHLAEKYAPLQSNGNGNQVAYLVSVSDGFAKVLLKKSESQPTSLLKAQLQKKKKMTKLRKRLKVAPISEQHKNSSSFKLVEVREYLNLMSGSTRKMSDYRCFGHSFIDREPYQTLG